MTEPTTDETSLRLQLISTRAENLALRTPRNNKYHPLLKSDMNRRIFLTSTALVTFGAGCLRGQTDTTPSAEDTDTDAGSSSPEPTTGSTDSRTTTAGADERLDSEWPQYGSNAANTAHVPGPAGPTEVAERSKITSRANDSLVLFGDRLYTGGTRFNTEGGAVSRVVNRGQHAIVRNGQLLVSGTGEDGRLGKISALALSSSGHSWEKTLEPVDENQSFPNGSPALAHETFYQATGDGTLHAINVATGDTRWKYNLGTQKRQTPAIQDEIIYISGSNETAALSRTGEVNWTQPYDFTSSPVVKGDNLYLFGDTGYDTDQGVYVLDINDGSIQWSRDIGSLGWEGIRNIAVDDESVYVNTNTDIYAFSQDGVEEWQTRFDGPGELCLSDNYLYAIGKDSSAGAITAVTKDAGNQIWREIVDSPILTEPVISGLDLYFGAGDGTYVIREPSVE